MSRPRLNAEQKKVSFSLAFSPNLISALEKVRGAKSQSVFVEEWLRQQPQIAAELAAIKDSGFTPPISRYEQLMDHLLAFYSPDSVEQADIQSTLMIAQKVIIRKHDRPDAEIEAQIGTDMVDFWLKERHKYGTRHVQGENLEAVLPGIKAYAHFY